MLATESEESMYIPKDSLFGRNGRSGAPFLCLQMQKLDGDDQRKSIYTPKLVGRLTDVVCRNLY